MYVFFKTNTCSKKIYYSIKDFFINIYSRITWNGNPIMQVFYNKSIEENKTLLIC